jgi:hypothetical protein
MWSNFFIDTVKNVYFAGDGEIQERERQEMRGILIQKHGEADIGIKIDRYFNFKPPDFVLITEFQPLLQEVEDAYVSGYLYPSLTGACCIGERILNLLLLRLRDYHKSSPSYKDIYRKQSFDDWTICIRVLREWNVISDELVEKFNELKDIRNQSVHFRNLPQLEDRALTALEFVMQITDALFGLRYDLLFLEGHFFIKKAKENDPLVREFYIPQCARVGYRYQIEDRNGRATLIDNHDYEDREITDEQFIALVREARRGK